MLAVVDDVAVVQAWMEAVGEETAPGDGKGVGRGSAGVRKVTREGVAGVEGDSPAAVTGYLDGSAGIVALGGVGDALDYAPAGVGAVIGDQRTIVGDGRCCTDRVEIG